MRDRRGFGDSFSHVVLSYQSRSGTLQLLPQIQTHLASIELKKVKMTKPFYLFSHVSRGGAWNSFPYVFDVGRIDGEIFRQAHEMAYLSEVHVPVL